MELGTRIKNLREEAGLTQLAFAKILNINNSTLSQYESGDRIPSDATKVKIADFFGVSLDYLTNADLKNAPPAEEVIPNVWSFIEGFVLVGHNIPFDIKFLREKFAKNGYTGQFNYVDTLQLARSAFPDFPNHKLATCIEKLSLSDGQTHRALDDIICTQRLLEKCLAVLLEQKERELAERRAARV